MKSIPLGFTDDTSPDGKPCVGIVGLESVGKTRLAALAPDPQGWIVTDRKTRDTVDAIKAEFGKTIIMNKEDYVGQKDALVMAVSEDHNKAIKLYTEVQKRITDQAMQLASHPDIQTIVIDSGSTLCDYITFSHFGRKTGVGMARNWGPPKQDLKDLLAALKYKTLVLTLRAKEVWKDDKPTGKYSWEGLTNLGYEMNVVVNLRGDRKLRTVDGEKEPWQNRFALSVMQCQFNKATEDVPELLVGSDIDWENLASQCFPQYL